MHDSYRQLLKYIVDLITCNFVVFVRLVKMVLKLVSNQLDKVLFLEKPAFVLMALVEEAECLVLEF